MLFRNFLNKYTIFLAGSKLSEHWSLIQVFYKNIQIGQSFPVFLILILI